MNQSIQGESFPRRSPGNLATLATILTVAALWPIAAFAEGGAVLEMTSVQHRGGSLAGGAIGSPDQLTTFSEHAPTRARAPEFVQVVSAMPASARKHWGSVRG
jgi:hypothetical protein